MSEGQSREKRKERVKKYLTWVRVNFKLTYLNIVTVPVRQKETSSLSFKYSKIEVGRYNVGYTVVLKKH